MTETPIDTSQSSSTAEHEPGERARIDGIGADDAAPVEMPRPRTTTVLVILAAAAVTLSYLFAYALTNAMVSSGLIKQWPPGHDPRPRNMLIGFCSLMLAFILFGWGARWASKRQLRSIEQMDAAEAGDAEGDSLLRFATAPKTTE